MSDMLELNTLAELLEKDIEKCEIDWMRILFEQVVSGKIGNDMFMISVCAKKFLLITVLKETEILERVKPLLNDFMKEGPICSYDISTEVGLTSTLEWELVDPTTRIMQLVTGKVFKNSTIENLVLFGRELSDFTSDQAIQTFNEAEVERAKNTHIFGAYPGTFSGDITKMGEIDLWLWIDTLGGIIWRQNHDESHGRVSHIDMTEPQYAIEYLVYHLCKKLDIEVTEPAIDKHIRPSKDYQRWYEFYSNHFKDKLSDKEWDEFQKIKESDGDTSKYLPKGDWRK